MENELFRDRSRAGAILSDHLLDYRDKGAWVLAIPRGGVPVGYEVAVRLKAGFDVVIPRRIPIPWNPSAGLGAVAEEDVTVLSEAMVRALGLRSNEIDAVADAARREVAAAVQEYRGGRSLPDMTGRPAIIVDDGLASGYTMLAAIEAVRRRHPSEVVVAVPVASSGSVRLVSRKADKMISMVTSERVPFDIDSYYMTRRSVTTEEALDYLSRPLA